ncbi:MAG: type II secretion system protein, partial [Victivallales bacterium]
MKSISTLKGRMHSGFTLVEILVMFVVIMILAAILLPVLYRAKDMAKFTRWFAFNRACANDPSLIINFNFQEGQGNTLTNICAGADVENYKAYEYDG